jgi:hypothetical protein
MKVPLTDPTSMKVPLMELVPPCAWAREAVAAHA